MTPNPDDILAAQLWPWPDPVMKRDPYGRILFVNHAFLQMFGGSIEQWHGQVLDGWHTPQAGGGVHRFEIRMPGPNGSEQVHDWMEQSDVHGNGLAMARDISDYLTHAAAPAQPAVPDMAAPSTDPVQDAPFQAQTGQAASVSSHSGPTQSFDPHAGSTGHAPIDLAVPEPAQTVAPLAQAAPASQPEPGLSSYDTQAADSAPSAPAQADPAPTAPASPAYTEQPARDFERRALPIEDGDAVLGNNWRDAVIAKAVGVGDDDDDSAGVSSDTSAVTEHTQDAASSVAAGDTIKILLAEDNAINALLTRTLLEAEGHSVETVEDGQLAVDAMKTQSFDLIFMDMRMPNMDGLEATRNIRRLPNVSNDLPIIALTANAFDDDRKACFDSGMNDFMTKPVSAEELSEMVSRWTGNDESEQRLAS